MDDQHTYEELEKRIEELKEEVLYHKQAVRKAEDEREHLDGILAVLNTGLALINPDMTVAWINDMIRRLLPFGEPVGKKCHEFTEQRTEPCELCPTLMAFSDGQIHETERQSPINGRWFLLVAIPIKDETSAVVQVLESSTDITVFKNTELERNLAMKELEKLKDQLEAENIYLRDEIQTVQGFKEIVGKSNPLLYALSKVEQVAKTDSTVLIQGETGVGKELFARAIHQTSLRSSKPFVRVNCAAIPAQLMESELFGHEPGAFTGANRLRRGRFEVADGGTIFLDEISEISIELQAKLLGVLQENEFERVGSSKTLSVDLRFIAATNRNLPTEIKNGRFRADLYYRLNVFPIIVPPLRYRRDDIPLLVEYFLAILSERIGKTINQVPQPVMDHLVSYDWPGNVRELSNVIERAIITCPGPVLHLPQTIGADIPNSGQPADSHDNLPTLEEVERHHILRVLKKAGWRISGSLGAAKILDLNPSTLRSRLKKLEIRRP